MINKENLNKIFARVIKRVSATHKLPGDFATKEFLSSLSYKEFKQGNFTIMVASTKNGDVIGVGATKRMPNDPSNFEIGRMIALSRCVENALVRGLDL